jgi:acetylornithine deacetylase/succinyl-diaminopimelate desuccinylase-like protein
MDVIELAQKLIAIPSYVDTNMNEKQLADFICEYISDTMPWLRLRRQAVSGDRYNIIALGSEDPQLVFVSHMDTVRPAGEAGRTLQPSIDANKLYGLGACDMKGGLAASLVAAQEAGSTSEIALIFDCDEEYYFRGMKKLLEGYRFRPRLVLFPEPTDLSILCGCRGLVEIGCDVVGQTAHSGTPELGINAIEKATELVVSLKQKLGSGGTTVNLSALTGGRMQGENIVIQANAVPDIARMLLDIRVSESGQNARSILNTMKTIAADLGIVLQGEEINLDYPAYRSARETLAWVAEVVQREVGEVTYNDQVSYFCEAALVTTAWGCPAIAIGPCPAKVAHKPEEYVEMDSLIKSKNIYRELIKVVSQPNSSAKA